MYRIMNRMSAFAAVRVAARPRPAPSDQREPLNCSTRAMLLSIHLSNPPGTVSDAVYGALDARETQSGSDKRRSIRYARRGGNGDDEYGRRSLGGCGVCCAVGVAAGRDATTESGEHGRGVAPLIAGSLASSRSMSRGVTV